LKCQLYENRSFGLFGPSGLFSLFGLFGLFGLFSRFGLFKNSEKGLRREKREILKTDFASRPSACGGLEFAEIAEEDELFTAKAPRTQRRNILFTNNPFLPQTKRDRIAATLPPVNPSGPSGIKNF